jgi:hypothetical protein
LYCFLLSKYSRSRNPVQSSYFWLHCTRISSISKRWSLYRKIVQSFVAMRLQHLFISKYFNLVVHVECNVLCFKKLSFKLKRETIIKYLNFKMFPLPAPLTEASIYISPLVCRNLKAEWYLKHFCFLPRSFDE